MVADFFDAAVVDLEDLEGVVAVGDDFVLGGEFAFDLEDEAGEGVGVAFDFLEGVVVGVGDFVEVVEEGGRLEDVGAVLGAGVGDFLFVVLVVDVADDFLDDVLHGDDAGGGTVLVDDDGHVDFVVLEFGEEVVDFLGFGDEVGGAYEGLPAEVGGGVEVLEQVFDVEQADDVVEVVLVNGHAGVAVFGDDAADGVEGVFLVDGDDVDAGADDVDGVYVAEAGDAVDDVLFLVVVVFFGGAILAVGEGVGGEDVVFIAPVVAGTGRGKEGDERFEEEGGKTQRAGHETDDGEGLLPGVGDGECFRGEREDDGDGEELDDQEPRGGK